MKKIKGYRETNRNFIHKILLNDETQRPKEIVLEKVEENKIHENKEEKQNCFALVVVRQIPWYKKVFRSIRNLIIIYKWRKAR